MEEALSNPHRRPNMRATTTSMMFVALSALFFSGCSDKGRAVALEMDGETVLAEEKCGSKDYVACGQRVRDQAKAALCQKRGKGRHEFLYKIGKGQPIKNTTSCT
jgi:hypothetical protein